jgi:Xaa-Pro aminopeptidase
LEQSNAIRAADILERLRRIVFLLACSLQLGATAPAEFAARRDKLRAAMPDGVIVLTGARESEDLHYSFFQETNFLYLTGWEEPGAILMITPARDGDTLFLPPRIPADEKWTGRKLGAEDAGVKEETGFAKVLSTNLFDAELQAARQQYSKDYSPADIKLAIAKLRMEKSPAEIAAIQHATDASIDAHRAAWRSIHPGAYEYQLAAVMVGTYLDDGCRRSAYAPIVGSGPNSTVLHYSRNSRRIDSGEVVVMDVAAECGNYASDITRTIPAGGRFSPRQREIYEIVLGAERAAIAAVKPGMTIGRKTPDSLYRIAFDYIDTHGKDLHGDSLGKYFTHGLSHHVGLDVHDASDTSAPLKAGMAITIEPGIYIPEENIGIRIEDVVLVTDTGSRVLSAALPVDPDEIERALAKRK